MASNILPSGRAQSNCLRHDRRHFPTVVFDYRRGEFTGMTERFMETLQAAYPSVRVEARLNTAALQLVAIPQLRKRDKIDHIVTVLDAAEARELHERQREDRREQKRALRVAQRVLSKSGASALMRSLILPRSIAS